MVSMRRARIYLPVIRRLDMSQLVILVSVIQKKEDLTHLFYMFRKPEPLDKYFNNVACSVTGAVLLIYIHRGK